MKTKILVFAMALSFFAFSCDDNDDKENPVPLAKNDVQSFSDLDNISDDVSYIAQSESNAEISGRFTTAGGANFLIGCASFSTSQDGSTWTRTIDFGDNNCTIFSGNQVRGKIILTFTDDFDATTRTISYAFDNFYHNDRHVEGNRSVVKTILENGHPQATISLNMTVTYPNTAVYTRVGERVREFTSGYDTPNILVDNQFAITGSWTTNSSVTGESLTATITSPIIIRWNCTRIVSGIIIFNRTDGNTGTLDYGDGTCDNNALLTINGVEYDIAL